jgi:hypothetical protein
VRQPSNVSRARKWLNGPRDVDLCTAQFFNFLDVLGVGMNRVNTVSVQQACFHLSEEQ